MKFGCDFSTLFRAKEVVCILAFFLLLKAVAPLNSFSYRTSNFQKIKEVLCGSACVFSKLLVLNEDFS